MKTYYLIGDIKHPGIVAARGNTVEEAIEAAERGEFIIEDEQGKNLSFDFAEVDDTRGEDEDGI